MQREVELLLTEKFDWIVQDDLSVAVMNRSLYRTLVVLHFFLVSVLVIMRHSNLTLWTTHDGLAWCLLSTTDRCFSNLSLN